jgi:excinuclease ABC subunit A
VELPGNTTAEQVEQWLSASGFTKVQAEREVATPTGPRKVLDVVADRFRLGTAEKARVVEAIEVALKRGGRLNVYVVGDSSHVVGESSHVIEGTSLAVSALIGVRAE